MQIRLTRALLVCAFPCLLVGQIAILNIKVVEGEGAIFAAGSRSPRPLAVQVTDEVGRPVAGAAVTFHMPEDGPGGVFGNGLRTEVAISDAAGRASVRNLQLNRVPGQFAIRIFAVKEQARAGTVSSQYVSDLVKPAASRSPGGSRRKWLAVALVAGGAAAGGLAAVALGGSPQVAAASPAAPLGVSIGPPTITVGKP